jgi:hypothetical protein
MRLLALLLLVSWSGAAVAQELPRNPVGPRQETRGAGRVVESRPVGQPRTPRASAAALASARAFLCPHGGTPQGRGRCTRGPGIGAAGTGWLGDDPTVRDWDQGLPPPTRAQTPCPPGTTAIPARDQPNVTRCVAS